MANAWLVLATRREKNIETAAANDSTSPINEPPSINDTPPQRLNSTKPDDSSRWANQVAVRDLTDTAVFRKSIAALPLKIYQAGETVLTAGYTTGQLLILRKGVVAVAKEGVEIARVTEPGAVFGEISALLDQPHSADVCALTSSQFHVADAAALLQDPAMLLYVASILARRLDGANRAVVELMTQVDYPRKMIEKTAQKIRGLLGSSGVHLPYLPYAGYNLFN
jgi:CRP-like cAMP-binding protein